jgi:hypothetical protein
MSAWGSSWGSSWAGAWGAIASAGRRVVLRFDSRAAKVVELDSRIWM